jgi:hypothetical protein
MRFVAHKPEAKASQPDLLKLAHNRAPHRNKPQHAKYP